MSENESNLDHLYSNESEGSDSIQTIFRIKEEWQILNLTINRPSHTFKYGSRFLNACYNPTQNLIEVSSTDKSGNVINERFAVTEDTGIYITEINIRHPYIMRLRALHSPLFNNQLPESNHLI